MHIADGHVSRLQALVAEVRALGLTPEAQLRELIGASSRSTPTRSMRTAC